MERFARACRMLAGVGIGALVLFTPLAFGSVETWAIVVLETALFAIAGLWILGRALGEARGEPPAGGTPLMVPLVLFVGIVVLQMIPLPKAALSILSPRASSLYERTIPGYARPAPSFDEWLLATDAERQQISPADHGQSIAAPVSYAPAESRDRLVLFTAYALLFFVVADRYRNPARLRRLVVWIVFVGVGVAIEGIFQKLAWNGKILWFRSPGPVAHPFGPFVNPNHFAGYMELIAPLAIGLLLTLISGQSDDEEERYDGARSRQVDFGRIDFDRPVRPWTATNRAPKAVLLGFLVALSIGSIVLSLSRGGFVATLLTLGIFSPALVRPARTGRSRTAMMVGGVALVVITLTVVFWLGASSVSDRAATLATMRTEPSFMGRVQAWQHTLDLIKDHAVMGVGLGGYEPAFSGYYPPGTYAIYKQAHNDYLQLAAEVGVAGVIPALLFLFVFVRRYLLPAILDRSRPNRYLLLGLSMSIVSLLLHSFVDFNLQIPAVGMLFVLIGGLLAASRVVGIGVRPPAPVAGVRRAALLACGILALGFAVFTATMGARRIEALRIAERLGRAWQGDRSAGLFDRALTLSRAHPTVLSALGDGAIASFDEAVATGAKASEPERLLLKAEGAYTTLTEEAPLVAWGWWGLGEMYARRSQLDRRNQTLALDAPLPTSEKDLARPAAIALACYRTAILLEPNSFQIHDDLAYLYRSEGLRSLATTAFRQSARIMPLYYLHAYPPPKDLPDDVYRPIAAGMEESLRTVDSLDPSTVYQSLGDIALERNDLEAAERHYRRGLNAAASPLMEGILANALGDVLQRLNRPQEARPLLLRATKTPIVAWRAWATLGHLESAAGAHAQALEDYRRAVLLAPEAEPWPALFLAAEMARTGDKSGAIAKLRYLISLRPDFPGARELLVQILVSESDREGALAEARSLLAMAPAREDYRSLVESLSRDVSP